jgi:hypothetical protein
LFLTRCVGALRFTAFVGDKVKQLAFLTGFNEKRLGMLPRLDGLIDLSTHSAQRCLLRIHTPLPFQPRFYGKPLRRLSIIGNDLLLNLGFKVLIPFLALSERASDLCQLHHQRLDGLSTQFPQ